MKHILLLVCLGILSAGIVSSPAQQASPPQLLQRVIEPLRTGMGWAASADSSAQGTLKSSDNGTAANIHFPGKGFENFQISQPPIPRTAIPSFGLRIPTSNQAEPGCL